VYWRHITGQELLGLSHNKFNDYTQIWFPFFSVSVFSVSFFPFPFFSVPGSHGRWQAAVNSLHSYAHLTIMISLLTNPCDVTIVCLFQVKVGVIDGRLRRRVTDVWHNAQHSLHGAVSATITRSLALINPIYRRRVFL